jgi:DNA polymerase-4
LVLAGLWARTVTIKVKYADFSIRTRRATLADAVQDTDAIHRAAVELLARMPLESRRVRLTGVSVSGIHQGPPAPELFPDAGAEKRRRLEQVATRIADRYGNESAITRATLIGKRR